jgi:hypothetical protein
VCRTDARGVFSQQARGAGSGCLRVDVTSWSVMKVSAVPSHLVPSPRQPGNGVAGRRLRRGLFLPLLAASLGCLTTFSATADEIWRQPAGAQWSIVGGDWHNSRYSTLDRINTQTVARLGGAWTSQKFDAGTMGQLIVQ